MILSTKLILIKPKKNGSSVFVHAGAGKRNVGHLNKMFIYYLVV